MNRVTAAIQRADERIAGFLGRGIDASGRPFDASKLDGLSRNLDMDLEEFAKFQTLKSAYMGSKLTEEEAQTIYGYLGETPDHFNGQPLPVKMVLTQIFSELLSARIARR